MCAPALPGYRYLKDLEGFEDDDARTDQVTRRFIVGRLAEIFLDDDAAISIERARDGAERATAELERSGPAEPDEAAALRSVLEAYADRSSVRLTSAMMTLGSRCEAAGHLFGAEAAYEAGFRLEGSLADAESAVNAAAIRWLRSLLPPPGSPIQVGISP